MMRLVWFNGMRGWELKDLSKSPMRTGYYVTLNKGPRYVVVVRVVPPARCVKSFTTLEDAKAFAEVSYRLGAK